MYAIHYRGGKRLSAVSYNFAVVSVNTVGWLSETDLLRAATAVACGSGHPAARALLRESDIRVVHVVEALNCERLPDGSAGVVAGSRVLLGGPELLLEQGIDLSGLPPIAVDGAMLFAAIDGRFAGVLQLG